MIGFSLSDRIVYLDGLQFFSDVSKVLETLYPDNPPQIMIVGHSMGGAICVHISHLRLIPTLLGCVVIDVVEGTAMEALASMQSFLRSRPTHFKSIQHAIEWRFVSLFVFYHIHTRVPFARWFSFCVLIKFVLTEAFEVDKYVMWIQLKCRCPARLLSKFLATTKSSAFILKRKKLFFFSQLFNRFASHQRTTYNYRRQRIVATNKIHQSTGYFGGC